MGFAKIAAASAAASLLLAQSASAGTFQTVHSYGSKFFYANGAQFFIKGVAYQQDVGTEGSTSGSAPDPLSSAANCQRDVPSLEKLGVNVIRTYALDTTQNHDDCMSMLQDAGIYVLTDLSSPTEAINRDDGQWTTDLYARYTAVIDMMAGYDNTLGFIAGNEVSNTANTTGASAFVKAAVRDSKDYIASKNYRDIPVGYATADVAAIRNDLAWYMNCGNGSSIVDFYGLNIYEWCGASTFQTSGYEADIEFYTNYSSAVLFTEDGCNSPAGGGAARKFTDVPVIFGPQMDSVLNGVIIYEYFEDTNDYGLVSIDGSSVSTMADYTALSSQYAAATPSSTSSSDYKPTNTPAACPAISESWLADGENLPPTPDANLCDCMYSTLSCVPSSSLAATSYGALFGQVCGLNNGNACKGIQANYTTGVYGAYSMCNSTQQLGYVLNAYYLQEGSAASACSFGGMGQVVRPAGAASSCSASLASASSAIAVAATATSAPSSTASKSFAVPIRMRSAFAVGDLAVGLYVVVAMGVGATMVML